MTQGILITAAATLICAAPAPGQAVRLQRKYTPGEKVEVTSVEKVAQELDFGFGNQKRASTNSKKTLVANGKRNSNGELTRTYSLLEMKIKSTDPSGLLEFDSRNPAAAKVPQIPGVPDFEKHIRKSFETSLKAIRTYTYNADNVLVKAKLSGFDVTSLPKEIVGQFDEQKMLQTRQAELKRFPPTREIKPGEVWEGKSVMPLGGGQMLHQTLQYKYIGRAQRGDKMLDRITVKTLAAELKGQAAAVKVVGSELEPTEASKGEIWFDREAGRLAASKAVLNVAGTIALELQGQKLEGQLDLKIESKTEVRPHAPKAEK